MVSKGIVHVALFTAAEKARKCMHVVYFSVPHMSSNGLPLWRVQAGKSRVKFQTKSHLNSKEKEYRQIVYVEAGTCTKAPHSVKAVILHYSPVSE